MHKEVPMLNKHQINNKLFQRTDIQSYFFVTYKPRYINSLTNLFIGLDINCLSAFFFKLSKILKAIFSKDLLAGINNEHPAGQRSHVADIPL